MIPVALAAAAAPAAELGLGVGTTSLGFAPGAPHPLAEATLSAPVLARGRAALRLGGEIGGGDHRHLFSMAHAGATVSGRAGLLRSPAFAQLDAGVGTQILLQLSVEPEMRGRVMSLYGLIFRGGPAVGALLMGVTSEAVGLRWPLAAGAALTLVACATIWLRRARLDAALEPGEASP